ncbi:MAG TPA: hypothetical protein VGT05_00680 [Patescibacteria group bacterium]|nr:hypothetical protein [Patescibacteria group bacterium]
MDIRRFLTIAILVIIAVVSGTAVFLNIAGVHATWNTTQSAQASCDPQTQNAQILVQFNNNGTKQIAALAKDNQTGVAVQLGTVNPHTQKSATISTNVIQLNNGSVTFSLKQGFSSAQKTVRYLGTSVCTINTASSFFVSPTPNTSKLPGTGVSFISWFWLLAIIPAGYFLKKFAST